MRAFFKKHLIKTATYATGLAVVVATSAAPAGGYLAVDTTGQPFKWVGPITVNLDQGPLGKLSKSEADTFVLNAMSKWTATNISGSAVQFVRGPDLSEDHGDGQGADPNADYGKTPDGITAIIYDQFGTYTDQSLGANMSLSVAGWAGPTIPDDYSPTPLSEGIVVLNGRLIDGDVDGGLAPDLDPDVYQGVITHEVGHMLNLDHSQAAVAFSETGFDAGSIGGVSEPRHPPDLRGVPTMFPFVMPEISTLETDDKAWITSLYPDAALAASHGSISGSIRTIDNLPFDGANIVAFNADDPTSMITCVSGYADSDAITSPSGNYLIPSLPPGSQWVVDVEPLVDAFNTLSSVGPELEQPVIMPGAPEFINEAGFESTSDSALVSTTFQVPGNPATRHFTDVNLRFNDIEDVDFVTEVDTGTDELTAQLVPVTPGRYTYIQGHIDPTEMNPQDLGFYGVYYDFYRVRPPAGVELNQVFIQGQSVILDCSVFEWRPDGETHRIVTTVAAFGAPSLSLSLDSTHMGSAPHEGEFYIGVCYPDPFLGGESPRVTLSDYVLGLLFSVSDRDGLVVKGADNGEINPDAGVVQIKGRGFKSTGGSPSVAFSNPGIGVDNVTLVDANTLNVAISKQPGFQPGLTTIQVTNSPASGGYAGRAVQQMTGTASHVSDWELY